MTKEQLPYAQKIYNTLMLKGFSVSIDNTGDKLEKKIRIANLDGYNYSGVVGPKEV